MDDYNNLQPAKVVAEAYLRIKPYIYNTPLLQSNLLNKMLNGKVFLKIDAEQRTGAFKIRGVLNYLITLKEKGRLPKKIVAYSTGNHALAMAYAAKLFGIQARIYLPENVLPIKKFVAKEYGAEVIEVKTRQRAEDAAKFDSMKNGYNYLPPSDDDTVIAGAGTLCYEALLEMIRLDIQPDVIFASCSGGGLLAGSYLAKELLLPKAQLHGVEPQNADDAYRSLQAGEIFRFQNSPNTIADGLRALSISPRTFAYLKKLDGFHVVEEQLIKYWTAFLIQKMKIVCEPSSAINMAAAYEWAKNNEVNKVILILMTGGNIDSQLHQKLSKLNLSLSDINYHL